MYSFASPLLKGRLIQRYKRFLADIELDSGEIITAHCPNTGAMTGCAKPGARVWLSTSDKPTRKYLHTWEYSSDQYGSKIGVNTANANKVVERALRQRRIEALYHYGSVYPETKYQDSRLDFMLQEDGAPDAYVEVKSVTLVDELAHASKPSSRALFPDAVTTRGQKHCYKLASIAQRGQVAVLLFCIQRENIQDFSIASHIDPKYAEALEYAQKKGVVVLAYDCQMGESGMQLNQNIVFS